MYKLFLKRLIDFIFALVGLIVFSPIFLLLGFVLFIVYRGNPFFIQPRPGKNERIFYVIKFRTMNNKTNSKGELLPDSNRLTGLGRFLRKSSLDELPQLVNVVIGNMSLIGPRPLLVDYLPLYSSIQKRRHEVKPGITGWAQINGRNFLSWEQKFQLDVWYVDHMSLTLDFRIFVKTLIKILVREGVSSKTSETMEKFKGSI